MGNKASKQYELSSDSLKTYAQLINMGFDEKISMDAAKRYNKNMDKCIDYITTKDKISKSSAKKDENDTCTYKSRIDTLLKLYQQLEIDQHNKKEDGIHNFVLKQYENNDGISGFVKDYSDYVQNIDNVYREHINVTHLYTHQMLDQLHICKYHLIDFGLRYIADDEIKDNANHIEHKNDIQLYQMTKSLRIKRNRFEKLRRECDDHKSNDNNHMYINSDLSNKFVTEILNLDNKTNNCKSYSEYSFGIRFYYHDYYKNNQTKEEILPGTDMMDRGNHSIKPFYTYSSWFIRPKYKSMKNEIFSGKVKLSIIQYDNTLKKATLKYTSLAKYIRGSNGFWKIVYGIKRNSTITLNHILSVLLYTNHTDLSSQFSRSFRKLSPSETDDALKKRHSEYYNWAKTLREAVECWGTYLIQAESINAFYHGISCQMLFDGFNKRFCAPTSTTLQYSTAVMFANQGNGIVITIKNNVTVSAFYNCVSWSDFPGESEMLFLGGFQLLEISGLTVMSDSCKYDKWVRMIKIFENGLIKGIESTDKITISDEQSLETLVNASICGRNDVDEQNVIESKKSNLVPKYVNALFESLINKTVSVTIDVGKLNKEICFERETVGTFYGYKVIKNFYLTDENRIKWDVLKKVFPFLTTVHVRCIEKISKSMNSFKYSGSVYVDDLLMCNVLKYLTNTNNKFQGIIIHHPLNNMNSLNEMISNYSRSFGKIRFTLLTREHTHARYGSCTTFYIIDSGIKLK
eukprot:352413_1